MTTSTLKRGNWTDNNCYYVSIIDGKQFNTVAGPFRTHKEALDMVEPARKIGRVTDSKSHFYSWGTVKMTNGYKDGCLNKQLHI